jgi:hypothetical protein
VSFARRIRRVRTVETGTPVMRIFIALTSRAIDAPRTLGDDVGVEVQVFDHAVVFTGDVDVQVIPGSLLSASNPVRAMTVGPLLWPIRRRGRLGELPGRNADGDIAFGGVGLEGETESILVGDVVADGGGQTDVVEQADGVETLFCLTLAVFHQIGDEMTRR